MRKYSFKIWLILATILLISWPLKVLSEEDSFVIGDDAVLDREDRQDKAEEEKEEEPSIRRFGSKSVSEKVADEKKRIAEGKKNGSIPNPRLRNEDDVMRHTSKVIKKLKSSNTKKRKPIPIGKKKTKEKTKKISKAKKKDKKDK